MTSPCEQPNLHSIDQAIASLQLLLPTPLQTTNVDLFNAQGRILAAPIFAQLCVPRWDNSAMDGYVFNSQSVSVSQAIKVAGIIAAGDNPEQTLSPGQCMRIYTGAPIPQGADTVVAQEQCQRLEDTIILSSINPGQNIRRQGEESQAGQPLLAPGTRLRAQEIGLLASQGYDQVSVYQPLRVGLISSGNELCPPGKPLTAGQIYDANRYTLHALLSSWGVVVQHYPNLPDDLEQTLTTLRQASQEQDLIITSGGVSVSEADHLKTAVSQLGELNLWKVAIQPGKPLAFGRIGQTPWLGLPGNPAASLVTATIIAKPALLRAQGQALGTGSSSYKVKAGFERHKLSVRQQYLQARLVQRADGIYAELHPQQSSAMLANACWAEGLVCIKPQQQVNAGDEIEFIYY